MERLKRGIGIVDDADSVSIQAKYVQHVLPPVGNISGVLDMSIELNVFCLVFMLCQLHYSLYSDNNTCIVVQQVALSAVLSLCMQCSVLSG